MCIQIASFHRKLEAHLRLIISYMLYNTIVPVLTVISDQILSYDVASGSEITPCNKIDKPLVVYRFTGNVMTSITTLRT